MVCGLKPIEITMQNHPGAIQIPSQGCQFQTFLCKWHLAIKFESCWGHVGLLLVSTASFQVSIIEKAPRKGNGIESPCQTET